jgi:hypothetical protein
MSYEQIKDLRPPLFKRYCGGKPETFQKVVAAFLTLPSSIRYSALAFVTTASPQ